MAEGELHFQKTHVEFPAPVSGASHLPVTPALRHPVGASGLIRYLHSRAHTQDMQCCKSIINLLKRVQELAGRLSGYRYLLPSPVQSAGPAW